MGAKVAGAASFATYGRAINTRFNKQFDLSGSHPGFQLMVVINDKGDVVDYPIPEAMAMPVERKGDRKVVGFKLGKQTITNIDYDVALAIPGKHMRLGRAALYGPQIDNLARRARTHPLYLMGGLLNNAFSGTKAHDGKALCATNHTVGRPSVTINNKGTAALAGTSFAAARAALYSFEDEKNGYRWGGMESLALIVPPDLEDAARAIVVANTGSSGETNVRKGQAEVVVVPMLHSNPAYWFLAVKEMPPFVHQIQEALKFAARFNEDSDNVWNRDEYQYGVRGSYAVGVGDYRSIWGSDGTA